MDINKTKLHYNSWVLTSVLCLLPGTGWGGGLPPLPRSPTVGLDSTSLCSAVASTLFPFKAASRKIYIRAVGRKGFSGEYICSRGSSNLLT